MRPFGTQEMRHVGTCWDLVMTPVGTRRAHLLGPGRADLLGHEITPACACVCTWWAVTVLTALRHLEQKTFYAFSP